MSRKLAAMCATFLALVFLAGCSAPRVELKFFYTVPEISDTCIELVKGLPGHVLDQGQRPLAPIQGNNGEDLRPVAAAWGDPVISLICGFEEPSEISPVPEHISVNGIDWYIEPRTNGQWFTSTNLSVTVQVRVPKDYAPETNVLADLSDALNKYVVAS